MRIELTVPSVGESITEVEIGEWQKTEGDFARADEVLAVLETDKATVELRAPSAGSLVEVTKKKGETAKVGEVVGYMETDAEEPAERGGEEKEQKAERARAKPEQRASQETRKERPKAPPPRREAERATARDRKAQVEAEGSVEAEPEAERERRRAFRPDDERDGSSEDDRVMPAARRLIDEHGLRPEEIEGTGPGGRLLKEDVLRYLDDREEVRPSDEEEGEASPYAGREEEVVPMSLLRRRIAKRLVRAQTEAALLTTFNEIDMSAVIAARRAHQDEFQARHGVKLGFMSFFVKAAIDALKRFPQINAEVRGDAIAYRNYYDVSVAIGGGKGLVVPVIRDADAMSFAEIELAIQDFAERAKKNTLKVEELQGGTFTISNGGIYGSLLSTPIVNPPQSGILGLHRIEDRPVARDGQVVIRPMMYVALTYDHRIVDGREAVTFLVRIKETIEDPVRLLVEA